MAVTNLTSDFKLKGNEVTEFHLGKKCLAAMEKYSDKVQQVNLSDNISETHGSVRTRTIRLAQALRSRDIGYGDVILLCSPNNNDISIPFIAALYLGTPIMSIPENLTKGELTYYMNLGLPRIAFCSYKQADPIKEMADELNLPMEVVVIDGPGDSTHTPFSEFQKPTGTEDEFRVTEFDPATTTALIMLSSGSTGFPKGICLNHDLIAYVVGIPSYPFDPELVSRDVVLYSSSLFWISGAVIVIMVCLLGQTRLHASVPLTPEMAYQAIEKYKPNGLIFSKTGATEFLKHPEVSKPDYEMPSVDVFLILGSLMTDEMKAALIKKTPNGRVSNSYGLTECSGPVTTIQKGCKKVNTVGKIIPWMQWKLISEESGEEVTKPHQNGVLWLKGPTVFKNYYRNPESTAEAFSSDGFFNTGDIMYYDEDKDFYFVDRCKQILKYRGYEVSPVELEQTILTLEGVEYACVVGLDDEVNVHVPMAFVQRRKGFNVTAQEIKDVVKNNLSDHKQLRAGVVFLDSMPLTHNEKVNRKYLQSIKGSVVPE